jgi:hypothetical protein
MVQTHKLYRLFAPYIGNKMKRAFLFMLRQGPLLKWCSRYSLFFSRQRNTALSISRIYATRLRRKFT